MNALAKPLRPAKHPAHMGWVASQGCLICNGPAECHHVRTGHRAKDDARVVPLCAEHHRGRFGFHGLGSEAAFAAMYGVDLSSVALQLAGESPYLGAGA